MIAKKKLPSAPNRISGDARQPLRAPGFSTGRWVQLSGMLFMLVLLQACSAIPKSVHEGGLQKRKHMKGWHVDLALLGKVYPAPVARHKTGPALSIQPASSPMASATEEIIVITEGIPVQPTANTRGRTDTKLPVAVAAAAPQNLDIQQHDQEEEPENLLPKKRTSFLGIPALVLVLAGIGAAFLTNDALLVLGLLALGILLASIALRRMRKHGRKGKGPAIVAMVLGTMAALITAMVIIRTGL
ncbi:MAG: hypothetical protein KF905_01520 [Flavobacteriales bacterium]|nr:hypothetical protein [Flavobacteriales bacterium]